MKLGNLYKFFAEQKEGKWIMQWQNAQLLYEFVKKNDIKNVLDLGTGIGLSASVIALALKDKGVEYHIDSVEQFDKCIALAEKLIPPELKEKVTIHKSDVEVVQFDGMPYQYFSVYKTLPEGDYDLILNDGPSPFLENDQYIDLPNGTIIEMLTGERLKPGTFVAWDGRIAAYKTLERYYGGNFYLISPINGARFQVIQRKDNKVNYLDERMSFMKQAGYFSEMELEGKTPRTQGSQI